MIGLRGKQPGTIVWQTNPGAVEVSVRGLEWNYQFVLKDLQLLWSLRQD